MTHGIETGEAPSDGAMQGIETGDAIILTRQVTEQAAGNRPPRAGRSQQWGGDGHQGRADPSSGAGTATKEINVDRKWGQQRRGRQRLGDGRPGVIIADGDLQRNQNRSEEEKKKLDQNQALVARAGERKKNLCSDTMLGISNLYFQEAKGQYIYMYRCEEYAGNPSYKWGIHNT
jgi:hypothetical protein